MGGGRISAEGDSSALDVGAGDVDLQGCHVRSGRDDLGNRDVVLGSVPGDIGNDRQVRETLGQPRQLLGHDDVETRILQTDGIEHPAGGLGDPRNRIAGTRLNGGRLDHDRSQH